MSALTTPRPQRFQSFAETADSSRVSDRLSALREQMIAEGLDAFLVPRADEYQGEQVPPGSARLAWLTGFTGSAGMAIVGRERAALLVDSRYTLQAPAQTDTGLVEVLETPPGTLSGWALEALPKGARIGFDPWLLTTGAEADLRKKLKGAELVPVPNLVDRIWTEDRPSAPIDPIEILGTNRSGQATEKKIQELQQALRGDEIGATILTLPESGCWLFNIRGTDVPNTPFVLGFSIVPAKGKPSLFVVPEKITDQTRAQLGPIVELRDIAELDDALLALGQSRTQVGIDPANCPAHIASLLEKCGAVLVKNRDPVLTRKARKNETELAGMREAHRLDGIALAKFLKWFDENAPKGGLTEIGIVTALEDFRRDDPTLTDISFDTISGAGPNGAVVHYRVTEKTNRTLKPGEIMLVDSGGQYLSGTTDITRTLYTGAATSEQKDRYTRVLKGMIAISRARFPKGTSGAQIDVLARQFLWQAGVTYNHGTGHGVGAYLGVHEGPTGISPRYTLPLETGMILSNEPGYYKTGEYGIRIENLIHVVPSAVGDDFLEFETLTRAPIDTRLVDTALLSDAEIAWLNSYHRDVFNEIAPHLDSETKAWLQQATAPIEKR